MTSTQQQQQRFRLTIQQPAADGSGGGSSADAAALRAAAAGLRLGGLSPSASFGGGSVDGTPTGTARLASTEVGRGWAPVSREHVLSWRLGGLVVQALDKRVGQAHLSVLSVLACPLPRPHSLPTRPRAAVGQEAGGRGRWPAAAALDCVLG